MNFQTFQAEFCKVCRPLSPLLQDFLRDTGSLAQNKDVYSSLRNLLPIEVLLHNFLNKYKE